MIAMANGRAGWTAALFLCLPVCLPGAAQADFARDIQPIFQQRCIVCHGPRQQMSGLRLDQKDAALKGGYSGAVIQPRNSAGSRLIRLVSGLESKIVMPPIGPRLTDAEIGLLRAWIDAGAPWPAAAASANATPPASKSSHWAFQKPQRPDVPAVRGRAWVRNPVDAFVLAKLESEGIAPSAEANKSTLIRRLSLDLIGLPPTPGEVQQFLEDNRPDAYERVVDRLLDSPHYGEKWARHWLDLARYADSDGYEKDNSRPWAWRYRQWVIDAMNRDMPFDEFTIEQIAGDLLPHSTTDQKVATGFHRNTLTNREAGTDTEQFRDEQVIDRTNTIGTAWLGLTVGCAQCHDHKYDPISQKEYYQLFAFLNTAEEVNIDAPMPGELGPYLEARPAYEKKLTELMAQYKAPELQADFEQKLRFAAANPGKHADWDFAYNGFHVMVDNGAKILALGPGQRTRRQQDTLTRYFINHYDGLVTKERWKEIQFEELQGKLKELDATLPPLSQAPAVAENDAPPKTYIHIRGDYRQKGIEVQPGTPAGLPPLPAGPQLPRLRLARWLVSRDNPLTARVTVNRMWQELFGRGLVRTSEDFGAQGERPSHPAMLDWLAVEFMDRGWSMKQMVRLLVTSAAYRQSSLARPELKERDPENALLARQSRLRLPAELIRDEALAAGGLLNPAIGGKSVRPPQPKGVSELSYGNSVKWPESQGPDRYRRGLYIHFQRTTPYPMLMNFDAPNSNLTCSRRQRSNTPLQALNLLNDPVFFEAAQSMAFRLVREAPGDFRDRLSYAFELALAREPNSRESERLAKYFDAEVSELQKDPETAQALFPNRFEGVQPVEAAAWVGVARVILNLDEFINRE